LAKSIPHTSRADGRIAARRTDQAIPTRKTK
jgi:hypothetical protein